MNRTILTLAIATLAILPTAAHAGTTEDAAHGIIKLAGLKQDAPLHLRNLATTQCDAEAGTVTPFSTTCMVPTSWPQAKCYVSLNITSRDHAHGKVLCGRGKGPRASQWFWSVKYTFTAAGFVFTSRQVTGTPPWAL